MKTAKLNDYQKRALRRFEAAYIALLDANVGLIAYPKEEDNVGLYAYSCEDMEEPVEMAVCEEYLDARYECISDDLEDVEFFNVDTVMNDAGYQAYAKFKEDEE